MTIMVQKPDRCQIINVHFIYIILAQFLLYVKIRPSEVTVAFETYVLMQF